MTPISLVRTPVLPMTESRFPLTLRVGFGAYHKSKVILRLSYYTQRDEKLLPSIRG